MKTSEDSKFLSGLLDFLATRKFFPDVISSNEQFSFKIITANNVEYICAGQSKPGDNSSTTYEIRRSLPSYTNFPHMDSFLHFSRFFALMNQPFAIIFSGDGTLELSCTGIHQTKAPFDFPCLADLFDLYSQQIITAMDRISSQSWSNEEVEGMVYILNGLVRQDYYDAT